MPRLNHESILAAKNLSDINLDGLSPDTVQKLHRNLLRLRRIEEQLINEYHPADEMKCPIHFCVGQEAVSSSLSILMRPDDYVFSHHRSHGYYFGKNAPINALFAELYGKETGASGGRAGSQDISMADCRFHSGAILCGAVSIGVGAAFALKNKGGDNVVVTGFGEAATDEGIFWEAISFAALRELPIVFVCENNKYSTYSPQCDRQPADNLHEKVASFGMDAKPIFGNDVANVYATLDTAIRKARQRKGPTLIEAYTYRWNGHVGPENDDAKIGYRPTEEIAFWKDHCPIKLLEAALVKRGEWKQAVKDRYVAEIDAEIAGAFKFAKESAFPTDADWQSLNYASETPLADQLLADVEAGAFDQNQAEAIPGPY